jgi:PAS domain-containing protein
MSIVVATLAMAAFGLTLAHRLRRHSRRMRDAIDNMLEGLCMFDRNERLVLSNQRYRDVCKIPPRWRSRAFPDRVARIPALQQEPVDRHRRLSPQAQGVAGAGADHRRSPATAA